MSSELIRSALSKTLQVSSLSDMIRVKTSEDVWILIDVSGSMDRLMRNRKKRIGGLREVVKEIGMGRRLKMIAFGGDFEGVRIVDYVPDPEGGTPLAEAINLAKASNAGRCIVISDGVPNDKSAALRAAKQFAGQIDVIFVGDPGDEGEPFLMQLAQSTGGTEFAGDLSEPKEIANKISGLLTAGED